MILKALGIDESVFVLFFGLFELSFCEQYLPTALGPMFQQYLQRVLPAILDGTLHPLDDALFV